MDAGAGSDEDLGEMAVPGLDALAMIDFDHVAIAPGTLGAIDDAVGGGVDRGSDRAGDIDTGMHRCSAAERIGTDAVIAGEGKVLDREGRRDRDHTLLERIELLP